MARLPWTRCIWVAAVVCLLEGKRQSVLAEDYNVRNWHMEEGLPDGEITAIAQTRDEYLWIGTPKGLARFDGTRFRVYVPRNTPELRDAEVANLLTDHTGRLWIGTADGTMVRWSDGKFDHVFKPSEALSATARQQAAQDWRKSHNWHLIEDGQHRIWWLQRGLAIVHFEENASKTYTELDGLAVGLIEKLGRDTQGDVWAAAKSRLRRFNNGHWDPEAESIPMSWPWHEIVLQPAMNGGLLLAEPLRGSWEEYGGQVRRLKDGRWTGRFEPTPFERGSSRSMVTALLQDSTGRMWIGTGAGGLYFSDADGQWRRVQANSTLSEGYISCLMQDLQENIWVGTVGDGLYRVARQPVSIVSLPSPQPASAVVQSTCVSHDGSVWIGTDGKGLYHYQSGQVTNCGTALNPSDLFISSVLEDRHTNVWLGTKSGLLRLENGRFVPVHGADELSQSVMSIYEDREGRLWVGTTRDLICRNGDESTICRLPTDQGTPDVRSIIQDKSGDIWVGTFGQGLFVLSQGNPAAAARRVDRYPASSARAMICDGDGTLWIGSWGDGIFRLRNGEFTAFSSEDGLSRDKILCIVPDRAGVLWMSSDNGIFGIKRQALESYTRGVSPPLLCQRLSLWQGLANRACSGLGQPVGARTLDGRLWFPNMEGVAVLDPQLAAGLRVNPKVIIESTLADGVEIKPADQEIRAPSSTRRFEFSFASPDPSQTKDVYFRHRLEGMDDTWRPASGDRIAHYSQLPPGPYKFRVAVGGSDGQWHESSQVIGLRIVPRLWELRWVQVVASAVLIGAIVGAIARNQRRKLRLKLERMELQQSLEQERRRIARDLHDELGARLTSIALQGELAMRGEKIPAAAKAEIGSLSQRVRQLINATDEVIWTTDPGNDSLPDLVEFLCDYIERFLTPAGIRYRLDIPSDLPREPIQSQTRHHFLLAVKETLNNAVRHSKAEMLMVKLSMEDHTVRLTISDNGIGFDIQHARPGGNGLANIKNRMASVGGEAEIASTLGKGTTTRLTMPLQAERRNGRHRNSASTALK